MADASAPQIMSRLQLPPGPWSTVFECLCARFPAIPADVWRDRFRRERVLDAQGRPLHLDTRYRTGAEITYFREVAAEPSIPHAERILHADAHLLVADKPHFLPVMPAGGYVNETLLARLRSRTGCDDLVPLHRIDRDTAGLVLFSVRRESRAAYQALFRDRRIVKRYEALAPPLPALAFPYVHRSRLLPGTPFFRMQEDSGGTPNSETHIDVVARDGPLWRYALWPVTGRKHQLRVHMAALGAPIAHDILYPTLCTDADDAIRPPLKLLAASLAFEDPLDGTPRTFHSTFTL